MGLLDHSANDNTGQPFTVSTVSRQFDVRLPSGSRFLGQWDTAVVHGRNAMATPIVRILIARDVLPTEAMPEVHSGILNLLRNVTALDTTHITLQMIKEGFIFEVVSVRDVWHLFRKVQLVYVFRVRRPLLEQFAEAVARRMYMHSD